MLLEGQDAESRTVFRKKEHNVGRFSGIYVLRPWNPLKYILPSHRRKGSTALFELRSKIGFASAKFENEFSLCIRLTRSLTYWNNENDRWGWRNNNCVPWGTHFFQTHTRMRICVRTFINL